MIVIFRILRMASRIYIWGKNILRQLPGGVAGQSRMYPYYNLVISICKEKDRIYL